MFGGLFMQEHVVAEHNCSLLLRNNVRGGLVFTSTLGGVRPGLCPILKEGWGTEMGYQKQGQSKSWPKTFLCFSNMEQEKILVYGENRGLQSFVSPASRISQDHEHVGRRSWQDPADPGATEGASRLAIVNLEQRVLDLLCVCVCALMLPPPVNSHLSGIMYPRCT